MIIGFGGKVKDYDVVEMYYAWPKIIKHKFWFHLLQAMVAKFSSISTRKLSRALSVLTRDKTMVATSDYGDFHKRSSVML